MNRSKFSLTISSGARTCTSGSPRCGRSSRTSRARNANTRCAVVRSHSAGATIRLSSSTTIRASPARRQPGAKAFSAWSPMWAWATPASSWASRSRAWRRNNADWHRLLEICALADTLILDEDGVYDPASFNDRLLLGLKGTMSEAELHVLKARLRGGILNKARRGEYRCPLPTGLVYDEAGNVVLDPDAQIRETIAYFFETFSRVGSASQTVKVFRNEGLVFPSRLRNGEHGRLPATDRIDGDAHAAQSAICGRLRVRPPAIPAGRRRQEDDPAKREPVIGWPAFRMLIPATSVGSDFRRISKSSRPTVTDTKWRARRRPAKGRRCCRDAPSAGDAEGTSVSDMSRDEDRQEAWYVCDRGHTARGEPNCQSIAGAPIDEAIGCTRCRGDDARGRRIGPRDQTRDRGPVRRGRSATLPRRLSAPRSKRISRSADSCWSIRATASLPTPWNGNGTTSYGHWPRPERNESGRDSRIDVVLDDAVRQRLVAMTTDFRKLWDDPDTANRERKRLLAYIIEDATLIKIPAEGITKIHVRFKGGRTETLTTRNPKSSAQQIKTPARDRANWSTNCSTTTSTPKSPLYSMSEGFARAHPRDQAERLTAFRPST